MLRRSDIEYLLAAAVVLTVLAVAARGEDCPPVGLVPCENVRLHDADTVHADLVLGWSVVLRDKPIRAFGYDAWEINRVRQTVTITDAEIERGKEAKAALQALIDGGTLYVADSGERDPYGRVSAWLWVKSKDGAWIDVAAWAKRHKYVRDQ